MHFNFNKGIIFPVKQTHTQIWSWEWFWLLLSPNVITDRITSFPSAAASSYHPSASGGATLGIIRALLLLHPGVEVCLHTDGCGSSVLSWPPSSSFPSSDWSRESSEALSFRLLDSESSVTFSRGFFCPPCGSHSEANTPITGWRWTHSCYSSMNLWGCILNVELWRKLKGLCHSRLFQAAVKCKHAFQNWSSICCDSPWEYHRIELSAKAILFFMGIFSCWESKQSPFWSCPKAEVFISGHET